MHTIVWRFRVRPGKEAEFEQVYGPKGAWAQLFKTDTGFLGTALVRGGPGDYVTIDRWRSRPAYDQFLQRCRSQYVELDAACTALVDAEALLGAFNMAD